LGSAKRLQSNLVGDGGSALLAQSSGFAAWARLVIASLLYTGLGILLLFLRDRGGVGWRVFLRASGGTLVVIGLLCVDISNLKTQRFTFIYLPRR